MEENLRHGKLDALVCTSSLELGIDVGSIDRVLQLGSARSVDRLLQRVGRADHRLGGVGRGVLLTHDHEDLEESTVIALCALKGDLEPVRWRRSPLTVARINWSRWSMHMAVFASMSPPWSSHAPPNSQGGIAPGPSNWPTCSLNGGCFASSRSLRGTQNGGHGHRTSGISSLRPAIAKVSHDRRHDRGSEMYRNSMSDGGHGPHPFRRSSPVGGSDLQDAPDLGRGRTSR